MSAFVTHFAACLRLLSHRQRRDYAIVLTLATFSALMELLGIAAVIPVISILVDYDNAMGHAPLQWAHRALGEPERALFLKLLTLAAIVLVWISGGLTLLTIFAKQRFLKRINADLSTRAFRGHLSQPIESFYARPSSEFMRNVSGISERVSMGVIGESIVLVSRSLQLVFIVAILVAVNYLVALILVAVIFGSYVGIYLGIRRRLTRMALENFAEARILQQLIIGSYQAYRSIVVDQQLESFVRHFGELRRAASRKAANIEIIGATPRQLIEIMGISLLLGASYAIGRNAANSHELISVIALLGIAAYRMLPSAQQVYHAVSRIGASLAVYAKVADQWRDLQEPPPPAVPGRAVAGRPQRLELRNASYSFDDAPLLEHLSIILDLQGLIRIAGPSGAGKSTLLELLTGLRQPREGAVLLDGVPLTQLDLKTWWSRISYLSQGDYLLEGSLRENIALSDERVDEQRLQQVAAICDLASLGRGQRFQPELPIAEGGVNLSGGQKNRVLLARALYKKSDIILLDEAFAALDVESAREILGRVKLAFPSRCIIVISHRDAELPDEVRTLEISRPAAAAASSATAAGPTVQDRRAV